MIKEIWKPILKGVYAVSDLGRVKRIARDYRSSPSGLLRLFRLRDGYLVVNMTVRGKRYRRSVHSLVALAFIGPRPDGKQINHINGRKTSNQYLNLEYVTPQENSRHSVRTGLSPIGSRHHQTHLTERDVADIRKIYRYGLGEVLAKKYGVSSEAISMMVRRQTWKHVK